MRTAPITGITLGIGGAAVADKVVAAAEKVGATLRG